MTKTTVKNCNDMRGMALRCRLVDYKGLSVRRSDIWTFFTPNVASDVARLTLLLCMYYTYEATKTAGEPPFCKDLLICYIT